MRASAGRQLSGRVELKAMMPGRVVSVLVKPGDEIAAEHGVLTVEAMKMENEIRTPKAGRVIEVRVTAGQTVEKRPVLGRMGAPGPASHEISGGGARGERQRAEARAG